MEKLKTIFFTALSVLIAVFTFGLLSKAKKEAIQKKKDERDALIEEFDKMTEKSINNEKDNDHVKSVEEISNDVDNLLDDDF